jgi:hypothetical protein
LQRKLDATAGGSEGVGVGSSGEDLPKGSIVGRGRGWARLFGIG